MSMKNFKEDHPIIIGLAGKAGSGKTTVAESLVPKGSIEVSLGGIKWDHIFYSLPLYELASIKRTISGINSKNRQLYAIHDVLFDLYGGSSLGNIPSYDDLVQKVTSIYSLPVESEGTKPRSFMQQAGDICRNGFEDCFASWAIVKSNKMFSSYKKSLSEEDAQLPYAVIISDVRFINEAEKILEQPNGVIVCFDATQEILTERIIKRDGKPMTEEQLMHKSEQQINKIIDLATYVIDTSEMSIEEQVTSTLNCVGILKEQHA